MALIDHCQSDLDATRDGFGGDARVTAAPADGVSRPRELLSGTCSEPVPAATS
jgi:hypothetical protein